MKIRSILLVIALASVAATAALLITNSTSDRTIPSAKAAPHAGITLCRSEQAKAIALSASGLDCNAAYHAVLHFSTHRMLSYPSMATTPVFLDRGWSCWTHLESGPQDVLDVCVNGGAAIIYSTSLRWEKQHHITAFRAK